MTRSTAGWCFFSFAYQNDPNTESLKDDPGLIALWDRLGDRMARQRQWYEEHKDDPLFWGSTTAALQFPHPPITLDPGNLVRRQPGVRAAHVPGEIDQPAVEADQRQDDAPGRDPADCHPLIELTQ